MKTTNNNQKRAINRMLVASVAALMILSGRAAAQDQEQVKSLFRDDLKVTEVWVPEVKLNSIQGSIGTLVGIYGGAMINNTVLLGISGGVNLGHPRVNYGYFGGIVQVVYKASELVHFSGQMVIAYGSTKDYENPKHGLLDNFWNISGATFFMMEPGLNLEMNLSSRLTLVAGASYRMVSGLSENDENIAITHVTNEELSGINFNIGLKFSKVPKNKKR